MIKNVLQFMPIQIMQIIIGISCLLSHPILSSLNSTIYLNQRRKIEYGF